MFERGRQACWRNGGRTQFLRKAVNKEREELAEFLIGKASAYNDTDFYSAAVKLIGQKQVTLCKIKMGLPLWSEDMQYINDNLK